MKTIQNEYLHSINLKAKSDFPYLVLKVTENQQLPTSPGFGVMHWHEDLQFIYVTEGHVSLKTLENEEILSPGEGAFINKNIVHFISKINHCSYTSFVFPDYFLSFYLGSTANKFVQRITENSQLQTLLLYPEHTYGQQALTILQELICLEERSDELYQYQVLNKLTSLWLCLLHQVPAQTEPYHNPTSLRTRQFLQYIEKHFSEDITLADIAQSASVSKSECLRCFKETLQTTPYKYLLDFRLSRAAQLLEETALPVGEIAVRTGFNQQSYFGKCFREKTQLAPKDYRKRHQ